MDARRFSPSCARNREPILEVLRRVLPARGSVLELASGTGEHAVHFAEHLPGLVFYPSDVSPAALASIEAWRAFVQLGNMRSPVTLDVTAPEWPLESAAAGGPGALDAVLCANMIHISPWDCCLGLMRGAGRYLRAGGVLVIYGPFRINGEHTAPSNRDFDASLRRRDPRWGVRDLEDVMAAAADCELDFVERVSMPANNLSLIFHRR